MVDAHNARTRAPDSESSPPGAFYTGSLLAIDRFPFCVSTDFKHESLGRARGDWTIGLWCEYWYSGTV